MVRLTDPSAPATIGHSLSFYQAASLVDPSAIVGSFDLLLPTCGMATTENILLALPNQQVGKISMHFSSLNDDPALILTDNVGMEISTDGRIGFQDGSFTITHGEIKTQLRCFSLRTVRPDLESSVLHTCLRPHYDVDMIHPERVVTVSTSAQKFVLGNETLLTDLHLNPRYSDVIYDSYFQARVQLMAAELTHLTTLRGDTNFSVQAAVNMAARFLTRNLNPGTPEFAEALAQTKHLFQEHVETFSRK